MVIDANEPELCERLLCPEDECKLHYSNVGNVNRHRVNNHGRTYPGIAEECKSGRMRYKKVMALVVPRRRSKTCETATSEGGEEMDGGELDDALSEYGSPDDAAQPSRRTRHLEQPIIPPLPPLAGLVDHQENTFDAHAPDPYMDFNTCYVNDAFGAADAISPTVDGSIASHPPPFTGTTSISTPSSDWATPPPPYPAHPAGFPDDYGWARQDSSLPMNSAPVDEKFPSFDATPHDHSPYPLAYQPAAMVSYPPVPVAKLSLAPTMGFPSAPTTAFSPVPPPQEVFWRDQTDATMLRQQQQADAFRQQRRADAFRRQQEFTFHQSVASAQHPMAQAPRREQDAVMTRAQQQQVEDPWVAATMQQLHALAQQNLANSAATHFPMDFDRLAPQAGTSDLQQQSYAYYPPPRSNDFSLYPRDRVVYEQRGPPATAAPLFPAFDSCHFPALEPRQQISHASYDDVGQSAFSMSNFDDVLIPWSDFE